MFTTKSQLAKKVAEYYHEEYCSDDHSLKACPNFEPSRETRMLIKVLDEIHNDFIKK